MELCHSLIEKFQYFRLNQFYHGNVSLTYKSLVQHKKTIGPDLVHVPLKSPENDVPVLNRTPQHFLKHCKVARTICWTKPLTVLLLGSQCEKFVQLMLHFRWLRRA